MDERFMFRGKRTDNSEWIYGSLFYYDTKTMISFEPGVSFGTKDLIIDRFDEVDPKTVGQCTGLRDKNGKLIYEGDIVSDGTFKYEIRYHKYHGFINLQIGQPIHYLTGLFNHENLEIIGSVHENPELLGVGE